MRTRPRKAFFRVVVPSLAGLAMAVPLASRDLLGQAPPAPSPQPTAPAQPTASAQPTAPGQPAVPSQPATQPGPETVVIKIGDDVVTLGEFELFIDNLDPADQEMARGPYRRAWAESLANMKLLAREARKKELEKTPAVQRQLAVTRDQVLANAMVVNLQQTMDDAFLRKHFEEHRQQLERVSARHILIRTPGSPVPVRPGAKELTAEEARAKVDALAARVKAGEDFAELAAAESDDTGTSAEGGDLGSFTRGKMVEAFEKTAFTLKENEVSAPVQSQFGWHLIQVTGKYDTFEKLADVLREQLGPQRTNQVLRELREQTKVEMNENLVGPPLPRAPTSPDAAPPGSTPPAPTPPAPTPQ